jgi:hypothetical protein
MEKEDLDDAYAHIEATSPEDLRSALRELADDPQALSTPLAAPASEPRVPQVQSLQPVPAWDASERAGAMARRRNAVLAAAALIAGIVFGSVLAGRACSGRAGGPENPNLVLPSSTSPIFGPQPTPAQAGLPGEQGTVAATPTSAASPLQQGTASGAPAAAPGAATPTSAASPLQQGTASGTPATASGAVIPTPAGSPVQQAAPSGAPAASTRESGSTPESAGQPLAPGLVAPPGITQGK